MFLITGAAHTQSGCAEDETTTDAGMAGGGGSATGGGGSATGGGGDSGSFGGSGGTGGAIIADAAPPDAAPPDAAPLACPLDVLPEVVDLNLHPEGDGFRYAGDTTAAPNRTRSACGGEEAPDVLHRFVAPVTGSWRIDTESTAPKWDTLLSLHDTCLDTEDTRCNDDGAFPPLSQQNLQLIEGQEIFIVVDGHTGGASPDRGAYVLSLTPR